MDVLPAHLNRDSFRDSFKGLVALEIIPDLPIGFPINNIISLSRPYDALTIICAVCVYVCVERDNVVYWKTNRKIKNDLQCN